jgi:hypothetical protein
MLATLDLQDEEARTLLFEANLVNNESASMYARVSMLKIADIKKKIEQ